MLHDSEKCDAHGTADVWVENHDRMTNMVVEEP